MILHLLEWSTVGSTFVTAVAVSRWLWITGTRPYTWQRRLVVPKYSSVPLELGSGSDYVGYI